MKAYEQKLPTLNIPLQNAVNKQWHYISVDCSSKLTIHIVPLQG